MTRVTAVDLTDFRTIRYGSFGAGSHSPVVARRPLVTPRSARVLVQVGCLALVSAAPLGTVSAGTALVAAQVLGAVLVTLVARALRPGHVTTARMLRIWGVGALTSLVVVTWLHGIHGMEVPRAQLAAVLALVGLAALGRMRDAYTAAGTQLDAILATLPPRSDARHRTGADRVG